MKLVLATLAVAAASVAASVDRANATSECRGFQMCVPVAGPWVAVPVSGRVPRPQVEWQLTCPRGFIVGGVDAELSERAIDVWFYGASGSPVAPGRTTSRTIVFVATYVGSSAAAPTFRPHAGCIPASGGGSRTPTSFTGVVPPGKPTVRRVRTVQIKTVPRTISVGCRSDERLIATYSARGFRTTKPPSPQLVASLSARVTVTRDHVVVFAGGGGGVGVVQASAVCAGGR